MLSYVWRIMCIFPSWCWYAKNDGCFKVFFKRQWCSSYNGICTSKLWWTLLWICAFKSYATHAHTNTYTHAQAVYCCRFFLYTVCYFFQHRTAAATSLVRILYNERYNTHNIRYTLPSKPERARYAYMCVFERVMPYEKFTTTESNRP